MDVSVKGDPPGRALNVESRDGRMVGHLELKVLRKLQLSLSFLYLFCKEDHIFG